MGLNKPIDISDLATERDLEHLTEILSSLGGLKIKSVQHLEIAVRISGQEDATQRLITFDESLDPSKTIIITNGIIFDYIEGKAKTGTSYQVSYGISLGGLVVYLPQPQSYYSTSMRVPFTIITLD